MNKFNRLLRQEQINYLNAMVRYLQSENLSVFAGAGVSIDSGFVDWKGLLKPIIEQLGVNPNIDLSLVAQFYKNEYGRHDINELIYNEFNKKHKSNEIIKKLGKLPIKSYWTTNYDSLIEDTLTSSPILKKVHVVREKNQFKYKTPDTDVIVYKMHGDKTEPDYAIIAKNDYETYDKKRDVFSKALFTELISNTFLFIGFSFSDPNLERILSIVKHTFDNDEGHPRNHYCFMRRVQEKDYLANPNKEQFKQDRNFQRLRIREMRTYGIQTILIDDFSQISICIDYIKTRLDQNRVFISGSLLGDVQKDSKEAYFIKSLAQKLVDQKYKIVTGFGQNIGNYLFIGACLNKNISQIKNNLHSSIEAYPLVSAEHDIQQMREELISDCGSIITLFGKTDENTNDLVSDLKIDGVNIEFNIAEHLGITLIPVGGTGRTSKMLWKRIDEKYSDFYDETIKPYWEKLSLDLQHADEIVDAILKILEYENSITQVELEQKLLNYTEKQHVFLSFCYKSSHILAAKIRNLINETNFFEATEEEKIENRTETDKIQKWINKKIQDTVATILIYDEKIFNSNYVSYEISKSIKRNNKIIMIIPDNSDKIQTTKNISSRFECDIEFVFYQSEFSTVQRIIDILNKVLNN